jgi:hypothetical protein
MREGYEKLTVPLTARRNDPKPRRGGKMDLIQSRARVSFSSVPDGFFKSAVPWRSLHSHTAQNLALPVKLMHGPAVDGPVVIANHLRFSVVRHILPALLLGGQEFALGGPSVAAPAVDMLVVDNRHDARLR